MPRASLPPMSVIRGVSLTHPTIGRVMIGHVEFAPESGNTAPARNGKNKQSMVPMLKTDDHFTVTTLVQLSNRQWERHPVEEMLRQWTSDDSKLTAIPIVIAYNALPLNLNTSYSAFHPQTGRLVCKGDGCKARRRSENGVISIDCLAPDNCALAIELGCRLMTHFYFRIDGQNDPLGVFVLRSAGFNTLNRLAVHLKQLHGLSGGKIARMPLMMDGSSRQNHPAEHVDTNLFCRSGTSPWTQPDRDRQDSQDLPG